MPRWSATVRLPGGGTAIVCGSGRRAGTPRCRCGAASTLQCDYPIRSGDPRQCDVPGCHETGTCVNPGGCHMPPQTCDAYLCHRCAVPQGRNRDYCPHHTGAA